MTARDIVPLWEDILRKSLSKIDTGAKITASDLETLLGSKEKDHGIVCKKCFNAYTKLHKTLSEVDHNIKKVIDSGLLLQSSTTVGEKRMTLEDDIQPPAKRFCHSFPQHTNQHQDPSVSAQPKISPPAVVSVITSNEIVTG